MDAHQVAHRLWVGSKPPSSLERSRFGLLVLCALEDQRPRTGVRTLQCPLVDIEDRMDVESFTDATEAARAVNKARRAGVHVLVTCYAGVNRSAFVAALALVQSGVAPRDAIYAIRARRDPPISMTPLSNREFVRVLVEGL